MPDVEFRLPLGAGQQGKGLIRAYPLRAVRTGQIAHRHRYRPGPCASTSTPWPPVRAPSRRASAWIWCRPMRRASWPRLRRRPPAPRTPGPPMTARQGARPTVPSPSSSSIRAMAGVDPGALSGGVQEKDVVLAVARHLRTALEATGRYDVHMTRNTDVFVSLDRRLAILAREIGEPVHLDSCRQRGRGRTRRSRARRGRLHALGAGFQPAGAAPGREGERRRHAGRRRDRRRGGDGEVNSHPERPDAARDRELLGRFPRARCWRT